MAALASKDGFKYPEDKLLSLAKEVKKAADDKSRLTTGMSMTT